VKDFEYIDSLGCYCHFSNGGFERMVEARREVWFGSDGSGLLRSHFVRSVFFDDEQRARWEASDRGAREPAPGPSTDLFAPNCWRGPRAELAAISSDRSVHDVLARRRAPALHSIKQVIGEALVAESLRKPIFDLCVGLENAEVDENARDQLGRHGVGVGRTERDRREELIFNAETLELLGTRQVLIHADSGYAPAGAIVGWTCFVDRQLVMALPGDVPPVPGPPCASPGAGRGTPIRPGFTLSTGYFTDVRCHADRWLSDGIITERDHSALLAQQDEIDRVRSHHPPTAEGDQR
jgi:hypothetical protein